MDRRAFKPLALVTSYSLVALLLVALRFAGYIGWPWFWILAPIWLPVVVSAIAFAALVATLGRTDAP